MNDKNTNTTYKATTKLEHTLVRRVEELEQINLRLQVDNEARKLAQQGLRYGQEFLREVISSIEDTYITVFDQNCQVNFIWGSKLLEEKYGIVFQDLMGKDADDINSLLKKEILQAFETNQSYHGEWSEDRQGNIIWWDYTLSPIRDEENEMVAVVSAARDITESKKKEKKLRLNSQIMTHLSEGVYLVRLEDGIIVYANPAFEEMFDYNPGEMIGKKIKTVNAPTEKNLEEIIQDRMQILLATGEWHGEVRNIKKDGIYFWCYANVSLFDHPEYGRVIISVHTDITERKKAEVELKESEQRYRTQFEDAFDAIFIAEPETGIIVDCNKAATLLIGRDKSEIIGQHQKTLHPPEMSKGEFTEHFVEYRDGKKEQILETFVITKNGDLKDVAISANLIEFKGKKLMQGIFRDISERIKLKQKLQLFYQINKIQHEAQDLNSLLEKIFNLILKFTNFEMGGIYLPNEDRTVAKLVYSINLSNNFLKNAKEIEINKFPHNSIFIENKAIFTENYFKIDPIVAKKLNMGSVASIPLVSEKKVIGALNIARKESFVFSNEEKEFFISIGEEAGSTIQQFIIQQKLKKSLERLKESEEILRSTLESTVEGIIVVNEQNQITHYNSKIKSMWRVPQELIEEMDEQKLINYILNQLKDPEAFQSTVDQLYRIRIEDSNILHFKDGRFFEHNSIPLILGEEIRGRVWSFRDITEREKLEEKLKENERKLLYAEKIANFGYWEWDPINDELYWSDETFRSLGFEPQEFTPTFEIFLGIIHPSDLEFVQNHINNALENDVKYDIDFRIVRSNSEIIYINVQGDITRDVDGKVTLFAGTQLNITNRKQIEQKLKESEEILRSILESIVEGILVVNEQGQVTHYNSKFISMWRIPQELIKEKNDKKLIEYVLNQVKDPEAFQSKVEELYRSRNEDVDTLYFKDNRIFDRSSNPLTLNGEIRGRVWSFRDITERRKMAEKIRKSEEKYHNLFNKAHVGIFSTRVSDGKCMECNEYFAKMVGFDTIEECLNEYIGSKYYVNLNDREKILEVVKETGYIENYEVEVVKIDGTPYWTSFCVSLDLERQRLEGTVIDITKRKKKEDDSHLRTEIIENMIEGVCLVRADDGIIIYTNPAFEEIFGYNPGEIIGKDVSIVNAPTNKTPEETKEEIINILLETGEWHGEINNIKKDGRIFWCYANVSLLNHPEHGKLLVSIHTDITKRKKIELKLKESEERYRSFVKNYSGIAFRGDKNSIPLFFHGAVKEITGYTEQEFVEGKLPWLKLIHPDDLPSEEMMYKMPNTPDYAIQREYRIIRKDGQIRWVFESTQNIFDDEGKFIGVQGTINDITDLRRVEEALRESEGIMRSILENSPDYIMMIDKEGLIQFINRPLPGMKLSEFQYKKIYSVIGKNWHEILRDRISEIFKRGKAKSVKFKIQNSSRLSAVYEARFGALKRDWEIYGVIMICTDISDRDKIDHELKESEEKNRNIINNIPDIILETNMQGVVTYISPQCYDIMGYQPDELIGKNTIDFIHPEDISLLTEAWGKTIQTKETVSVAKYRLFHKNGDVINVFARGRYVNSNGNEKITLIIRDLTDPIDNK